MSLRKPEATSLNSVLGFSKQEVKLFYENLTSVLEKHEFGSHPIFNVDVRPASPSSTFLVRFLQLKDKNKWEQFPVAKEESWLQ